MPSSVRVVLRVFAVLIAVRGTTNFARPFGSGSGFVFFGAHLHGTTEAVVSVAFGVAMLAYAYGLWTMRRFALPLAVAYAGFVAANIVLFAVLQPQGSGAGYIAAAVAFVVIGVGVTVGAAVLLWRYRSELR